MIRDELPDRRAPPRLGSRRAAPSARAAAASIRDHRAMQPRPRVLAVAQSADPGGAERALARIAERLPSEGFDVELASPGRGANHRLPVGGLAAGAWPRALA